MTSHRHGILLATAGTAICAVFGILLLCGCDLSADRPSKSSKPATNAAPKSSAASSSTPAASASPVELPSKGTTAWGPVLPDTSTPAASPSPAAASPPATPPAAAQQKPTTVQKKAEVGVGKKGRGYGKGVIVTPIASLFAVRERMVFDVSIPEAMKLYKAMEDRAPKTHEEFMEKIIKANNIKLPELPQGHRYKYDPKTEQLMVESPAPE
jgi:hypothetical protein